MDDQAGLRSTLGAMAITIVVIGVDAVLLAPRVYEPLDVVALAVMAVLVVGVLAGSARWWARDPQSLVWVGGLFAAFVAIVMWLTGGQRSPYQDLLLLIVVASAVLRRPALVRIDFAAISAAAFSPALYESLAPAFIRDAVIDLGIWMAATMVVSTQAQRLRRERQQLEAAVEYRTAFLQSVSHELRTPLTVIRAGLATLRGPTATSRPEMTGELAALMERHAVRLSDRIDDLTLLDRLMRRSDFQHLDFRVIALDQVVRETVEDSQLATRRRVRVDLGGGVEVVADEAKIRRALEELLENAAQHTRADTTVTVSLRRPTAREAVLTIEDDGGGIDPAIGRDVLVPFVQGQRQRDEPNPGLGIGLPLAARIVDAHGGSMHVTSDGYGTSIEITLAAIPNTTHQTPTGSPNGQPRHAAEVGSLKAPAVRPHSRRAD